MSPEDAVSLAEARAEAAARAVRTAAVVQPLWAAARHLTAAVVLALFPLLFILDGAFDFPVSPVLPGLAILAVLIVALPFALVEVRVRRYRRRDADWQERNAAKAAGFARGALGLAAVWVLLWFLVGT